MNVQNVAVYSVALTQYAMINSCKDNFLKQTPVAQLRMYL